MYPVLFTIGNFRVDTYDVAWFVALAWALRWTVRRMALYEVDEDEGRRIIAWGLVGMLVGARSVEYIWNFSVYWNEPSLILDLSRGGLSEKGAILGAMITTFVLCRRGGTALFFRLCEVVILPAFFALALGRFWGCFFAGCCVGVESASPLALHFPFDAASVTRHATQIYYSLSATAILLSLLFVEKRIIRSKIPPHPVLTPLGLIFYAVMRVSIDTLRLNSGEMLKSNIALGAMIPFLMAWFLFSWKAFRKKPLKHNVIQI